MRILARYVSLLFLRNFFLGVFGLTVLFVFQALLDMLLRSQYDEKQVIIYHLLSIPDVFVQMTPPATLLATVLTLSGLSRTNELVACYSIGIGLRQLMMVLISIVFMISCFTVVLQDRILPPVFRKRTVFYWKEMRKRSDFFLDVKQDKIWYRSNNLIYNLRTFDVKSNTIFGMAVYTFDDQFNLVQVVEAQRAQHTPEGWRLNDGVVTVFTGDDMFPMSKKFEEKALVIDETPTDFREIEKEVDGLRLKELWRYIDRSKKAGADTKAYEVKFHARLSMSFIPMVMCFLALPFSTRKRREGGVAKDLSLCLAVTFFYWLFHSVGLSLGQNGALPPWLSAWLPSLVFTAVAAGLVSFRKT